MTRTSTEKQRKEGMLIPRRRVQGGRIAVIEFKQILCPVDFSESSIQSVTHAAALARWYEARLTVLHVVPTFEPMQIRGLLGEPVPVPQVSRDDVLEEMRRALDLSAVSPDATVIAETGNPAKTIVDHAVSNGTDLI